MVSKQRKLSNPSQNSSTESNDSLQEYSFESRDLEQAVIDKLAKHAEHEAQMIANFNAKVNAQEIETINTSNITDDDDNEQCGPKGLEPTRYGDWERKGRCYDF